MLPELTHERNAQLAELGWESPPKFCRTRGTSSAAWPHSRAALQHQQDFRSDRNWFAPARSHRIEPNPESPAQPGADLWFCLVRLTFARSTRHRKPSLNSLAICSCLRTMDGTAAGGVAASKEPGGLGPPVRQTDAAAETFAVFQMPRRLKMNSATDLPHLCDFDESHGVICWRRC